MPPIVKDSETAVATPTSAAPATTVAKTRDDSPSRPQPVALEIPVTVNGAHTVEGSDKREPFSENTVTVLVFSHGAVIRLASSLAPGQLVFLTNEKTKKEVVCQVIKSKNYRSVTGYVELEFTEPAVGFWGMRFPSDRPVSAAPAPVSAHAAPHAAVPAVPVPPKAVPPPLAAPPNAAKPAAPIPSMPAMPAPVKSAVELPPPPAPKPAAPISAAPVNIVAPSSVPPVIAHAAEQAVTLAPVVPSPPPPVTARPEPVATRRVPLSLPSPDFAAAISSLFDSPPVSEAKPAPTESPLTDAAPVPAEPSTEQLKQQTTRLQEQLSSLLFTEVPAKPPSSPVPAGIAKTESPMPEVADKLLQLAQAGPKPAAPAEIKPAAPVRNFVPPSLAAEQVKVPAWLAPLARESESTAAEPVAVPELPVLSATLPASLSASEESPAGGVTEFHRRPHSATFGGQLLGESGAPTPAVASRSKKGLFISIAATLLLATGVVWYMRQPDNRISSLLASKPAPAQAAHFSPAAVSTPAPQPAAPLASVTKPAPEPTSSPVIHSEPPATAAPAASPAAKNLRPTARTTPPVEEPKKSAVGEVHLATPVVNRAGGSQEGNESEPAIDVNQSANADPLAGLAAGPRKEPTAPLPVGGDLKQARLLKSASPIYPPTAKAQNISGDVKIDALIDVDGNVSAVKIISGPAMLHQAALDAVKQWKYDPAQLNGQPTEVHVAVTVHFRAH